MHNIAEVHMLHFVLHSDVDKGDGSIKYILSGEGASSIFIIDENTGDIHATKRLDREEQAYYTLRAQALDRLTSKPVEPESEFVIKIQDINDNEPKFLDGPYTAGVPEMSPVGKFLWLKISDFYVLKCFSH
uniref:Cadherin-7 n=1 Tax=Sphaerodactylus townsendi TaxID=933632 RepID=A0ACB8FD46_9SAUR